jgi:hypothetical protein
MSAEELIWNSLGPLEQQTALARFVVEGLPQIEELAAEAEATLAANTGDPSFDAYVSGGPGRVREQARALYECLRRRGLRYRVEPWGSLHGRQVVRCADTVLAGGHGCCIDLVLLLAGALRHVGLNPLIAVVGDAAGPSHAVLGYWLRECVVTGPAGLPQPVLTWDDLADHFAQINLVECTDLAGAPSRDFDQAERDARTHLPAGPAGRARLWYAVDVLACRRLGIRPLERPRPGPGGRPEPGPPGRAVVEALLRQAPLLERWRLFHFHRDICISDVYVQEQLRADASRSVLSGAVGMAPPPVHEQEVLNWVCGDVPAAERVCVIAGQAGAGKSTLLRSWAVQLLQRHRRPAAGRPPPLPVYLSLRYLPAGGRSAGAPTAEEWANCLARTVPALQGEAAEYPFRRARPGAGGGAEGEAPEWVFLCDGLDEMAPEARPRLWEWLRGLPASARAVLSSRPGVVEALPPLPLSRRYDVCNFNDDQVGQFIAQWFRDEAALGEQFRAEVQARAKLRRLAAIPLLLTCLSMDVEVRRSAAFPDGLLESDLLARAVEILLDRWDAAREGRPVEGRRLRLGAEVFRRLVLRHGFGAVIPHADLTACVAGCAARLGLGGAFAEDFLGRVTSSGTLLSGSPDDGYAFAHAVFFDYFFARAIEEGLPS